MNPHTIPVSYTTGDAEEQDLSDSDALRLEAKLSTRVAYEALRIYSDNLVRQMPGNTAFQVGFRAAAKQMRAMAESMIEFTEINGDWPEETH